MKLTPTGSLVKSSERVSVSRLRKWHRDLLRISLKQSPEILCLFADHASSALPAQQATPAYCFETLDSSNKSVFTSATTRRGSSVPEL